MLERARLLAVPKGLLLVSERDERTFEIPVGSSARLLAFLDQHR